MNPILVGLVNGCPVAGFEPTKEDTLRFEILEKIGTLILVTPGASREQIDVEENSYENMMPYSP